MHNFISFFFTSILILVFSITVQAKTVTIQAKTVQVNQKNQGGMVVSEHRLASQVGIDILKKGGNAIDAAVAVGYALAVVNPCCGNIGGGGFMLIHLPNKKGNHPQPAKNLFFNFREKAPLAVRSAAKNAKNVFLDKYGRVIPNKTTYGFMAVGTPGTVLGFETVLKKYGKLNRKTVMQPAITLAKKGFILAPGDIEILYPYTHDFAKQKNVAAIFLKNGQPYQAGDRLIQKDLAKTLQLIANKGADTFYHGAIAKQLVTAMRQNKGILSFADLNNYHVEQYKPIQCRYHQYAIVSAPPPSSGGVALCEMLNILEGFPLARLGYHSAEGARDIIEAMRYAFADRNRYLGDPNFIHNPTNYLISKSYAQTLQHKIKNFPHLPASQILENVNKTGVKDPHKESMHTTHYSIIDKEGNAVSVTYTLNSLFGAKVIAGKTGFFLNNEMDDFTIKTNQPNQFGLVQSEKNRVEPFKTPLSSMTPTFVFKNNHLQLILGSPGGPRIITSVLLTLLNVVDYHMTIQKAVDAPRFHHQLFPDWVQAERNTWPAQQRHQLEKWGYSIKNYPQWGAVEAIEINKSGIHGGSDRRRSAGKAMGID